MIHRPHGESNVTLLCQNRCVGCNHFIPLQEPWFVAPEELARDLNMAARIIHFDRYNLVGGEPTLHPRILDLLQIVIDADIADTYEITTNGQGYKKWDDSLYRLLDELIVTPYKLNDEDIQNIRSKCEQYGTALQIHPVIFTECAYKQPAPDDIAYGRYRACWYNINRHVIDGGYFYRCCTAPFIPQLLLGMPKETDGIALQGLTEQRLNEYLSQHATPASCFVCASNMGNRIDWRETSRDKWLEESVK